MIACAARVPGAVRAVAVLCVAGGVLAGCTSDGDDGPTSGPPPTVTSGSSGSPSAPSGSTTPSGDGLAALAGTYLLAGPTADTARIYRVAPDAVDRVTATNGFTGVTVRGSTVVVSRRSAGGEQVQELRNDRLLDIGLGDAFSPALSGTGRLAWAQLARGSGGPGISKPAGFTVFARPSVTGATRKLATFRTSVGSLAWSGDLLVVPVEEGQATRLVTVDGRGRVRDVTRVADSPDLVVTANRRSATVQTSDGAVVVDLATGRTRPLATGWTPLCWQDSGPSGRLVVARGRTLGLVTLSASGAPGTPAPLGSLPAGTSAFGGACP
ncbi:hypothetical protein GCM10027265_07000 [Jatrophihabitans fulvus]